MSVLKTRLQGRERQRGKSGTLSRSWLDPSRETLELPHLHNLEASRDQMVPREAAAGLQMGCLGVGVAAGWTTNLKE